MRQLIAYRAQNQSVGETEVQFCDAEEGGQEGTEGCEGRLLERCLRGREERRPRILAVDKRTLDAARLCSAHKVQTEGGQGEGVGVLLWHGPGVTLLFHQAQIDRHRGGPWKRRGDRTVRHRGDPRDF